MLDFYVKLVMEGQENYGGMLMLQIAVCDDSIDELSNMVQLIDLYRSSRHLNCEYADEWRC